MKPLRMFFPLSLIFFAIGLICLLSGSVISFTQAELSGTTTLAPVLFVLSVLFSVMAFNSLGFFILGEYLGRTYLEVRRRPRFIIDERVNFSNEVLQSEAEMAPFHDMIP